jgi:choline transport protein
MDLESNSQPLKPPLTDQNVQDAQDLAALGHSQALTRKFDMWSMLALAFCVLGMFALFATPMASECVLTCPKEPTRPSPRISAVV